MSARKMIQENGMSMKIIQFCNESKNFMKKFLEIVGFDTLGNVDYIEFTGDTHTSHGKPDITIRFNDGQYCIIEVKTDEKTDFQETQTDRKGYVDLIVEKNKVNPSQIEFHVESHFCFLLDPIHCKNMGKTITIDYEKGLKLEIPVISWNTIYEAVCDFGNRSLARDIEENVSGIKKDTTKESFSAYDLFLLSNSKLLYKSIKILSKISFKQEYIVKAKLKDILIDSNILDDLIIYEDKRGCWYDNKKKKINNQIFLGFSYELLKWKTVHMKINENFSKEDFLCSLSVDKELINLKKLEKSGKPYCEDENRWVYIPVDDNFLHIDPDTSLSCNKFDYKLDICHSLITLDRINKLVEESKDQIIEELKKTYPKKNFSIGEPYHYMQKNEMQIVGYYIDSCEVNKILYFGLADNIFTEKQERIIDELKLPNYFTCVTIYQDTIEECDSLINNGAVFESNKRIYFPISIKTLCMDDVVKPFVDEVVRLLKDAINKYGSNIS